MKNSIAKDKLVNAVIILSIVSLTAIIYSNTLSSPFIFDDHSNIVENTKIKNLSNFLDTSGSRYMGFLSFALNYHFGELNLLGYHLINTLIHITNGILVYMLVRLTFRTPQIQQLKVNNYRAAIFISLATALIFVSHPIQTQAVTYIVQRLSSLMTLFYLLSLVLYIKARLYLTSGITGKTSIFSLKHLTYYTFSLIFVILAMKTKENSFTLPFIIILYEVTFFTSLKNASIHSFFYFFPFLVTLLVIPLGSMADLEGRNPPFSRWEYLFTQFRVIVTYIRLLFCPVGQNLDYDYPIYHSLFTADVLFSLVLLLIIFGMAVYLYRLKSKCYLHTLTAFGIFWFFITLLIESSIIPLNEIIHEHRLYLPSVGAIMAFTSLMYYILNKKVCYLILAVIVISLSISTYKRNFIWESEQLLWEDAVAKSPNKARPHNNLGKAYYSSGNYKMALTLYNKAVEIDPLLKDSFYNRGLVYKDFKNYPLSIKDFTRTIELYPQHAKSYNNRGNIYSVTGRYLLAIDDFNKSIALVQTAETYYNRGNVYYIQANYSQAIQDYKKSAALNPKDADPHYKTGNIFYDLGRPSEAISHYYEALKINPEHTKVHNSLGKSLASQGKLEEAIIHYKKALRIDPEYALARYNLGIVYRKKGGQPELVW